MKLIPIEVRDILISLAVLTFVFAYPQVLSNPPFFLVSLFGVGIAFFGHELSHRYVARRYGFWSEFRMWPQGLFFALFLAIVSGGGFVFAAPGAVMFSPRFYFQHAGRKEIGRIGIAGSVFNIALAYALLATNIFFPFSLLVFAASINAWLAAFNMIPIAPLDGQKVLSWDKRIWVLVLALSLAAFAITFIM